MAEGVGKTAQDAVVAYKRLLASIIEKRPSGTRQRLATALAKNRSFVSQITNPAYATPVPARHLATLFELCHFSAAERDEFTRLYRIAHPGRMLSEDPERPFRAVMLPDLGSEDRNTQLHSLVSGFVREIARLIDAEREEGKRR